MEPALVDLAESQHHLFTTAQAAGMGISDRQLLRLKDRRMIWSVARSVYATRRPPTDAEARLRVDTHAALLVYPDAQPVGASALALQHIPLLGLRTWTADVVRPVRREVLTQLCRIRPPHPVLRPTIGLTSAAAAVVQTALDHGHVPAVVAADRLLHADVLTYDGLRTVAAFVVGWPHSARVTTTLALVDGRSESMGETRLRLFVQALGIRVVPQFPVDDVNGTFARVDLLVDGTNLCLEFDGLVKYGSEDKDVLWHEKKREDRVRRQGYVFERVIHADFATPVALTQRIRAAVHSAEPRPSVLDPRRRTA